MNAFFESGFQNPIDEALRGLKENVDGYTKIGEIPYDFIRKRLSIAVKDGDKATFITKGALKNILEICPSIRLEDGSIEPIEMHREKIEKHFSHYSSEGYRILGICYKDISHDTYRREHEVDMTFAGFIMMEDPLKAGIHDTIKALHKQGIKLKIITGDNRLVAAHVAKKLDIHPDKILTGPDIAKMS